MAKDYRPIIQPAIKILACVCVFKDAESLEMDNRTNAYYTYYTRSHRYWRNWEVVAKDWNVLLYDKAHSLFAVRQDYLISLNNPPVKKLK